jgi:hypothetical protein
MDEERSPLARMLVGTLVVAAIGGGAWYVLKKPPVKPTPAPAPVVAPVEAPVAEATPHYPVEAIEQAIAPQPDDPLPDLFTSDGFVRDALGLLFANPQLGEWLVSEHVAARFVAFVDALPNRRVSMNLWPVKPVSGSFFVQAAADGSHIGAANEARYDARVQALTTVDTRAAVALYLRLYPLLQQAYRELGYPDAHFNDRLVQVIDHLLAAPEPQGPVAVVLGDKGYVFADPALESASAGHKLLVRLGPTHEAQVKTKLREFRAALAGQKLP